MSENGEKTIIANQEFPLLEKSDLQEFLGRKYKSKIVTLYSLLCFIGEHYDRKTKVVSINQTNAELKSVYSNIHDVLTYLIDANVIRATDGKKYLVGAFSQKYIVCTENLNYLLTLSKQNGGEDKRIKAISRTVESGDDFYSEMFSAEDTDIAGIKKESDGKISILDYGGKCDISSNLLIDLSKYDVSDIETRIIIDNPLVEHYASLADELNQSIERAEEKIVYRINYRRSKLKYIHNITGKRYDEYEMRGKDKSQYHTESGRYIVKIGVRATSKVCGYKSKEKAKARYFGSGEWVADPFVRYREDYLDERFGTGNWEEYDVHASVPRISHFLQNAKNDFGNLNEDIYYSLFGRYLSDYTTYFDASVTEWEGDARNFFKSLFLRLNFSGSAAGILNQLTHSEKQKRMSYEARKAEAEAQGNVFDEAEVLTPWTDLIAKNGDKVIIALLRKWKSAVDAYCKAEDAKLSYNDSTKIFLHESNIYLEVRKELMRRGVDVVQVYDGFYFAKGTMPADIEDIITHAANHYKKAFLSRQIKSEKATAEYFTRYTKEYYLQHLDDGKTNAMLVAYLGDLIRQRKYITRETRADELDAYFQNLLDNAPATGYLENGEIDEEREKNIVTPSLAYIVRMRHYFERLCHTILVRVGGEKTADDIPLDSDEKREFIEFVFAVKSGDPVEKLLQKTKAKNEAK